MLTWKPKIYFLLWYNLQIIQKNFTDTGNSIRWLFKRKISYGRKMSLRKIDTVGNYRDGNMSVGILSSGKMSSGKLAWWETVFWETVAWEIVEWKIVEWETVMWETIVGKTSRGKLSWWETAVLQIVVDSQHLPISLDWLFGQFGWYGMVRGRGITAQDSPPKFICWF